MTQSQFGDDSINYDAIVPHRGVEIYELGGNTAVNSFPAQLVNLLNQLGQSINQLNLTIAPVVTELERLSVGGTYGIDWQQLEIIITRALNENWTPIVSEAFETIGSGAILPGHCSVTFINNGPNSCSVLGVPLYPQQQRSCGGCSRTLISNPLYFDAKGNHLVIMLNYPTNAASSNQAVAVKDTLTQLLTSDPQTKELILDVVNDALQKYLISRNC